MDALQEANAIPTRVLLVEDDSIIRANEKKDLERLGYEIAEAIVLADELALERDERPGQD